MYVNSPYNSSIVISNNDDIVCFIFHFFTLPCAKIRSGDSHEYIYNFGLFGSVVGNFIVVVCLYCGDRLVKFNCRVLTTANFIY